MNKSSVISKPGPQDGDIDGEAERIAALHSYHVLDTTPENAFDDLSSLAAHICDTPISLVSLVDAERQWFKARFGLGAVESPRTMSFCGYAIRQRELFEVPDALEDERFAENPLVTAEPFIRFYAGAPLIDDDGFALGTLCVLDRVPRVLSEAQRAALRILARHVISELSLRRNLALMRESDERYRDLFENATDLVQSVSPDGRIIFVNQAWCKAFDYTVEAAAALNIRDVITSDAWPGYSALVELLVSSGGSRQSIELEMRTRGGRRLSIEGNLNCKFKNGNAVAIRAILRDVTQRRTMERRLEQLRLRTQLILDTLAEGIMMIDMQGIITYANSSALRMLCHSDLGFIGKPLHSTVQHSYEDGTSYPAALSPVRLTARDGVRRSVQNEVFWRSDDKCFPIEYQVSAIYEDGLSIGAVISFHDVTEQRSAESNQKRLTSIIEASTDFVAIADRHGKPVYLNRAFRRAIGIGETDSLDKFSIRDIYIPEMAERIFHEAIPQATKTGTWSGEAILRGRYGKTIPVLQLIMAHRNASGSVDFFSSVMRDIAERLSIETMKDEFVSTVSHELRTPLTSIRGALGLLASGALGAVPEGGARMIDVAVTNTDRLIRLLNDILDIERMESNKLQFYRSPLRVPELAVAALEAVKVLADQTGTTISCDCEAGLEIVADQDRVMQTLTNLLSNAMKFSPPGAGVVRLSAYRDGDMALISITDNGRGIPYDKLSVIFERFQQVDASDAREKGGTGLGLAICRSIVQQHGGRIWAESQPGKGATFCFTLPAMPAAQATSAN